MVQYGPLLQDPEFDTALVRAKQSAFPDVLKTENYPFSSLTRAQSAPWFTRFAQEIDLAFTKTEEECIFTDISSLDVSVQEAIIQGCRYGFFQGYSGGFVPQDPLSKAAAIVVVTRILMSEQTFPIVKDFRVPYMDEAVIIGILHKPKHPYLMYPISRYELLLLVWRAYQYAGETIDNE